MKDLRIRQLHIIFFFSLVVLIYLIKIFYLQVLSPEFAALAHATDIEEKEILPSRGIIYDRNENIYVDVSPVFDIMFIPAEVDIPDTNSLAGLLGISKEEIRKEIKKYGSPAKFQWQPLKTGLTPIEHAQIIEHLWQFDGIEVRDRRTRKYNYPAGANFLGYLNEVNPKDKAFFAQQKDPFGYRDRDLIGRTGIERRYEELLRGKKGKKFILRDAFKREVDSYNNGTQDEAPEQGKDLLLGVDASLQVFCERLMQKKMGSIVAIEPSTGEILAFVSAPSYNPSLTSGSKGGKNIMQLLQDNKNKPLFNRASSAQYPPGSIFKMIQGLVALSEGIITPEQTFPCSGAWFRNHGKPHCHGAHGNCNLTKGIIHSCNPYFAETYYSFLTHPRFKDIKAAYNKWYECMSAFGIGKKLNTDIPDEKAGNLPTSSYFDKIHRNSWNALTVYSMAIGRGEILMTPLQIANIAAAIANRGYYITPHFLKAIRKPNQSWQELSYPKVNTPGEPAHYEAVINGMEQVVQQGTGFLARIDDIAVCGKTGTVDNSKIGMKDHSVFMAFAPKEKPKIAVAVVVQHAGFGGTWAAPISSLVIEQYLKGKIENEYKLKRILEADLISEQELQ